MEQKNETKKKKLKWYEYIILVFYYILFSPAIALKQQAKQQREADEKFHREYEQVGYEKGYIGWRPTSKVIYRKRKTN